MGEQEILKVENASKEYPGVRAIDSISISFNKGEVHAIVGENGAGKSTLMKILSGSIQPTQGKIYFEGKEYSHLYPKQSIELGISTIYQEFSLVNQLTVAENIFLGERGKNNYVFSSKEVNNKAKELIKKIGMDLDPKKIVSMLSPAQQQMVEILRAISRKVKILIMDEPSAPLSKKETRKLFEVINRLKNEGITILYISHRMEEIFELADRVTVLRDGKFIKTLMVNETNEDQLIRLMVGRNINQFFPVRDFKGEEVALELVNLNREGVLHDVTFNVKKGEILGLGGLVGAGRTETVRCLFGADQLDNGTIKLEDKEVIIKNPIDAIKKGIVLIPEDRKKEGLVLGMSVGDNIIATILKSISKATVLNSKKKSDVVTKYIKALNIKTPSEKQLAKNLSGGNQQKVVIAKMLATNSKVIILDEPTRGIDVGAKSEIYEIMNDLTKQGKTIIMVSSDMIELLGISDRVIVMRQGKVMCELNRDEFSEEKVLQLASGLKEKQEEMKI